MFCRFNLVAAVLPVGLAMLSAETVVAQPVVPLDFTIRHVSPLLDGVPPELCAIDDPEFGVGVITAVTEGDVATFRLVTPSGTIFVLGTVVEPELSGVAQVRLDHERIVEHAVHATLKRDLPGGSTADATTYVTIDPRGVATTRWKRGSVTDRIDYVFAFSNGQAGNPSGAVLLDGNIAHGTTLAFMDVRYEVTKVKQNSLPDGRTDTDVRGFQRDVTSLYGGGILVADSDPNDDDISAIYELRDVSLGGAYRLVTDEVSTSQRFYGDLAIVADGPFGGVIFVTEQRSEEIQTVDPQGIHRTWATGFTNINALSISPDGESMYVADQSGIWLIRESGTEPGPVILASNPSTPAGSTLTGAPVRSLRVIFNEPVSFVDADVTILDSSGSSVGFDVSGSGSQFMLIGLAEPLSADAYTVTIADSVSSAATGLALDGDGDGIAGGDAKLVFAHACQADFDGSGVLDFFDFLAFSEAFMAGCR